MRKAGSDSRAVREVVGYILIFSLIFTTVGLVSVAGIPTFDDARESEQKQNAERAFDVLNTNLAEVYDRGAPSRATELSADDGTVETGDPITFNVTVEDGSGITNSTEADINPIIFSGLGRTKFVYEGGAVFRDQPDSDVMLREPPFKVTDDRVFLPLVETYSNSLQSTGGGTVLVRAEATDRSVDIARESEQLNITVSNSPREAAWKRYFEEELGMSCTTGTDLDCGRALDSSGTRTFVTNQEIRIILEI
jgi:hypothetical protein